MDENEPESKTKLYKYPHVSMMLDVANIGDFVWHNLTYPEFPHAPHNETALQLVNLRQLKIRVFEFISQFSVNPTRPLISRRVPGLSMGATKLEDIKFSRPCVRVFNIGKLSKDRCFSISLHTLQILMSLFLKSLFLNMYIFKSCNRLDCRFIWFVLYNF